MGTCDISLVRKVDDGERTVDGLPSWYSTSEGGNGERTR